MPGLSDEQLRQMAERDAATEDGLVKPDYLCAQDRHLLLHEVQRLRLVVDQIRSGRPVARVD